MVLTVATSECGSCGAFNTNILRTAITTLNELESRGAQVEVAVIGRKGSDFFRRRAWAVRRDKVDVFDKLTFEHGVVMGEALVAIDDYVARRIDAVYVIYNEFNSAQA